MSRKRKPEAHASHDRWLVSYADFITLMFAFFVVMFASSQADKSRARQVSESVTEALQEGRVTAAVARMLGGSKSDTGKGNAMKKGPGGAAKAGPNPHALEDLKASLEYLSVALKPEIEAGKLRLRLDPRGLIVSLTEAAFFPSGEDTIVKAGYSSIDKIAVVIKELPNPVRLEGHTDAIPIHNSRFRSNWELSAARGIAMLELLSKRCQIPADRLAVAGYADTCPVDTNDTPEGRARNRRVDVVILNKDGSAVEPSQVANVAPGAGKPAASAPAAKPGAASAPAQKLAAAPAPPAKPALVQTTPVRNAAQVTNLKSVTRPPVQRTSALPKTVR
jgi:chemotaxis protein MotB